MLVPKELNGLFKDVEQVNSQIDLVGLLNHDSPDSHHSSQDCDFTGFSN